MKIINKIADELKKITELKKVVLYAYPRDHTPGCTTESNDFSNIYQSFVKLGVAIIGISPDSEESHEKFREKYNLKQELISDQDLNILKYFGAYGEKNMYGRISMGVKRSTFFLDLNDNILVKEWRNVRAKGHADKVYTSVKDLLS